MVSFTDPYEPDTAQAFIREYKEALLRQPPVPLGSVPRFRGPGICALYYDGKFRPYRPLAVRKENPGFPIFMGSGSRSLYNRIMDYLESLTPREDDDAERNIAYDEFFCRALVFKKPAYINAVMQELLDDLCPLWNTLISGFGNNDVGRTRYGQDRSLWDTLHPGRRGSAKGTPDVSAREIRRLVAEFFAARGMTEASAEDYGAHLPKVAVLNKSTGKVLQSEMNFPA